jgi:hypothetical protein
LQSLQHWDTWGGLEYLQAFIDEFDAQHLLRAGNPNIPLEIHFLLRGLAGFGVDIRAWGSYRWDMDFPPSLSTMISQKLQQVVL